MNERSFTSLSTGRAFNFSSAPASNSAVNMNKREQIMQVAMPLFIEQGFHGTSVQMIANQVGMATGSLYRYFHGKDELIRAIYRNAVEKMLLKLFEGVDLSVVCFASYRRLWLNAASAIPENSHVILFKELYERSPFFTEEDKSWAQGCWQPLDDFFLQGARQGLFLQLPPHLLGALSLATVQCVMHENKFYGVELTDMLKEQMAAASWKAILADNLDQTGSKE